MKATDPTRSIPVRGAEIEASTSIETGRASPTNARPVEPKAPDAPLEAPRALGNIAAFAADAKAKLLDGVPPGVLGALVGKTPVLGAPLGFAIRQDGLPRFDLKKLQGLMPPVEEQRYENRADLEQRKTEVKQKLWQLMGNLPDIAKGPKWSDVHFVEGSREIKKTGKGVEYIHERFYFTDGFGVVVPGRILIPRDVAEGKRKTSAVLYNHYHGGEFPLGTDELYLAGWGWGHRLINDGHIVMAIDAPGHGQRLDRSYESGYDAERDLDTILEMYGMSRLALRTYDDILAFQLLAEHPLVDSKRVGTMGMSMGSARTWLLTALLGDKIASAVAVGTIPRLQDAIATHTVGANNNNHFFPGQLAAGIEMESVILASAGVPLKIIIGTEDHGSMGFDKVLDYNRWAWDKLGVGRMFQPDVMQGIGHDWPPDELDRAQAWMKKNLAAR